MIAEIGDVIEFEHKGYKCRGIVYNVLENSVAVDVSQNACFIKEGIDRTIKKHTSYKVVSDVKAGVDTDKLRGIKTISNYSKTVKKEEKNLSERKYDRKELTKERYLKHKNNEGKKDAEIIRMYDIKSGSWTKIKNDLLSGAIINAAKDKPTSSTIASHEVKAPVTPPYESKVISRETHKEEIEHLKAKILQLQQDNTQLSVALNETTVAKSGLEVSVDKYKESFNLHIETIDMLEKDLNEANVQLQITKAERDKFELIANDNAMEVERLQREFTTYVQSQLVESKEDEANAKYFEELAEGYAQKHEVNSKEAECPRCQELTDKFNKQLDWYMQFEKMLHQRSVCLIDQVVSLTEEK